MDSHRRYNIQYIDDHVIVVAAGNTVKLLNLMTSSHVLLPGVAGNSIGAIAVRHHYLLTPQSLRHHL